MSSMGHSTPYGPPNNEKNRRKKTKKDNERKKRAGVSSSPLNKKGPKEKQTWKAVGEKEKGANEWMKMGVQKGY